MDFRSAPTATSPFLKAAFIPHVPPRPAFSSRTNFPPASSYSKYLRSSGIPSSKSSQKMVHGGACSHLKQHSASRSYGPLWFKSLTTLPKKSTKWRWIIVFSLIVRLTPPSCLPARSAHLSYTPFPKSFYQAHIRSSTNDNWICCDHKNAHLDRKSTRLNSSHVKISYA